MVRRVVTPIGAAKSAKSAARKPLRRPAPPTKEPAARQPLRTQKLTDQVDRLNILYFGNEGTGKTTNLATMSRYGRVLYVNAESGMKKRALEVMVGQGMGINLDNIELFPAEGDPLTFEALEDTFDQIKGDLEDDPTSWAGTAWDSATEITRKLLENITEVRSTKNRRALEKGATVSAMLADRFFTDIAEYGEMGNQVRWLVRRFRDLPCHFGIACLMRRDVDEETKRVHYGPAVIPSLQGDLAGWVDVVCRTSVEEIAGEDIYLGHFRPMGVYRGKDRFHAVPRTLVDPTFERVNSYIEGTITEATDESHREAQQRRKEAARASATAKTVVRKRRITRPVRKG